MARPCKSIEGQSRHNSKEDIEKRKETENKLRGLADKIEFPPDYLTEEQKLIYKEIFNELKASQILSNLDIYILSSCSIAIDRLQYIEQIINKKLKNFFILHLFTYFVCNIFYNFKHVFICAFVINTNQFYATSGFNQKANGTY